LIQWLLIHVAMAENGIVGRGVLLDYHSWRQKHNINPSYDAFKTSPIPLEHLQAVAKDQGVEFKFGDILFIRSGMFEPPRQRYTAFS
jgi:hypothetical protein